MLAAAREKAPHLTWRAGTAEAPPFDSAVFDGVLCMLSVHHVEDLAGPSSVGGEAGRLAAVRR